MFNAEGDLWSVSAEGGQARRITTNLGQEEWPLLSPEGQSIAFLASYEGRRDTYIIPVYGGRPRRITWDGARPVCWTPDGKVVVVSSKYSGLPDRRLLIIDPETMDLVPIPLAQAAEASVSSNGMIYFTRLPEIFCNSRWYKGGQAQNIWRYKDGMDEAEPLTQDYPGTSRQPVVMNDGRVYFLSDREKAMNIWSMNPEGADLARHTDYVDWDIQSLSGDGDRLVYRLGADIYTWDITSRASELVPITLVTDLEQAQVDWVTSSSRFMGDVALSSDGKRVAFVSRGELFSAPVKKGRVVHVSRDSGVRYRNVYFSKDDKEVLALSDKSDELEWWRTTVDGLGTPEQITNGPKMFRKGGLLSPDGKYLAEWSYEKEIWLVDLESGESTKISNLPSTRDNWLPTCCWAPNSRYLVFAEDTPSMMNALFVYDLDEKSTSQITSDRYIDGWPAISADGNWLFFVSSRTWKSTVSNPWGERAPQPHFEDNDKIYALPLREEAEFPNAIPNELTVDKKDKKKTKRRRKRIKNQLPLKK